MNLHLHPRKLSFFAAGLLISIGSICAQSECNALFVDHQVANTLKIIFTDQSQSPNSIASWTWDFGDGSTAATQNPYHVYSQPGTYEVCLTITDHHGCSHTYCHSIIVDAIEQSDCQASYTFTQDSNSLNVNFLDESTSSNTIITWLWNFGDNQTSSDQHPSHTYNHPGTYQVCLKIFDDQGCHSLICHQIEVAHGEEPGCHALFNYHQEVGTLIIVFQDLSESDQTITSWHWDFGDGEASDLQHPSHTYSHDGTYEVCLTIHDDHGCTATYCHAVKVKISEESDCYAIYEFHQDANSLTVEFTDQSTSDNTIIAWFWQFGDGHTSMEQNPSHTYNHEGTYEVCLKVKDDHGCISFTCHHIEISPGEVACHAAFTFEPDHAGLGVQFMNTSSGTSAHTTYMWEFGDGTTSTQENPYHIFDHTGHYAVCLFIEDETSDCSSHSCHVIHLHAGGGGHHHDFLLAIDDLGFHPEPGASGRSNRFENYPNPFSTSSTIYYELNQESEVMIALYDATGQLISEVVHATEKQGPHQHLISGEGLQPGFYFIRWTKGLETQVKVVTVIR